MYTVYILFSEKHNKSYAGYTSDMARRLMEHNETGEKGYTKAYRPWTLMYTEEYEDKNTAKINLIIAYLNTKFTVMNGIIILLMFL